MIKIITLCSLLLVCSQSLLAQSAPTDPLYEVTLLRAAPSLLPELIQAIATMDQEELVMRHSQGDHWDLMILRPITEKLSLHGNHFESLADFEHRFIVKSESSWDAITKLSLESEIFHIEMFNAAHGQHAALLKEREMENTYLTETGRLGNLIFETILGSDFDCFTLGFYESMVQFATDPDLSDAEYQAAASAAGFKSRSDIGFELRKYIVGHKDTIATKVK